MYGIGRHIVNTFNSKLKAEEGAKQNFEGRNKKVHFCIGSLPCTRSAKLGLQLQRQTDMFLHRSVSRVKCWSYITHLMKERHMVSEIHVATKPSAVRV